MRAELPYPQSADCRRPIRPTELGQRYARLSLQDIEVLIAQTSLNAKPTWTVSVSGAERSRLGACIWQSAYSVLLPPSIHIFALLGL